MKQDAPDNPSLGRRRFLAQVAGGPVAGALGVGPMKKLLAAQDSSAPFDLDPRKSHFPGRARSVIFLFQSGGPSQLDLFDPKPELVKWHRKPLPPSVTRELRLSFIKPDARVWASDRKFAPHGQCGMEISDWLPHIAGQVDDLCLVRSMHTETFNHHPGQCMLLSGNPVPGRPTLGAWVTYALGSESRDLPAFVVLSSGAGTDAGTSNWSSGFLPSIYAGVPFFQSENPILYLGSPPGVTPGTQSRIVDALKDLNRLRHRVTGDPETLSRTAAYELALRMQEAAPEVTNLEQEPESIREMYGIGRMPMHSYAMNCLLARRLVERGTRFVMVNHASWDSHTFLSKNHAQMCKTTDQPVAALLQDLKQRDMLDETLVVWGGEFGRTPMAEVRRPDEPESAGRDHQPTAFSMWLAGGGIRGGTVIGKTDDLGMSIAENPVHIHDLQATILRCLGIDHTRLTFPHLGRDFRLTDVGGRVVEEMLA